MSKGEATRERIVDEAFRLATRDGLAGVSLGQLASALGLSKSGLFAHFASKRELEVEVLRAAEEKFIAEVVRPALSAPRGIPRLRELFRNWLAWATDSSRPGGCVFLAAAVELDDSEGVQRERLVESQLRLRATLAKAARIAVEEGQFRSDVDCEQLAFEMQGIAFAYHHTVRLLRDPNALSRAEAAFERLILAAENGGAPG